jgi:hypothetical protein
MSNKTRASRGAPLDARSRARLRRLIAEFGVPETARRLRVAPNVVTRAAGDLPILLGSAMLIRAGLPNQGAEGQP